MPHLRIIARTPSRLRALCGLAPKALEKLLETTVPVLLARRRQQQDRPGRQRALGGGRKRGLRPEQELLLTLIYLRHHVAHEVVGALFGVSADTSENTFHEVIAALREACPAQRWEAEQHWKQGEPAWKPQDLDRVLVDSFETPRPRPSVEPASGGPIRGRRSATRSKRRW